MYALVNIMHQTHRSFGRIVSRHKSIEAAVVADRKLQRAVKRKNGQTSYLPTIVVWIHDNAGPEGRRSSDACRLWCTEVDPNTGDAVAGFWQ